MSSRKGLTKLFKMVEQMNSNQPVEQQFLNDLKRSIELDDIKGQRKPSKSYKPSSMNCLRSMYFQMTGAEVDKESAGYCLVGICNSGTDIKCRFLSEQMPANV